MGKGEDETFLVFCLLHRHDLNNWVLRGTWGTIQQRSSSSLFCRRPLWAVLAWAGMSTLWCSPSSISSADHSIVHPPRCPEGWFWRGCHGVWHFRTMQVSVSWQLPEEVPVDPHDSWFCSTVYAALHKFNPSEKSKMEPGRFLRHARTIHLQARVTVRINP